MTHYLSLRSRATRLLALLNEEPDLLVQLKPPKNPTELTRKVKPGEKVYSGKPKYNRSVDFDAIDLKADLMIALERNDYEGLIHSYYPLAYLISY